MSQEACDRMRVLIAEDDVISSKILQKNLLDWVMRLSWHGGEKAWQALQDPASGWPSWTG